MLLTLTTTHQPATDLGYLLHKHPERVQEFTLSFGKAHVFYPEASLSRCTAALLLELDPVGLVRGRRGSSGADFALEQYVNDRPYVASSFLAVAIGDVFGSALAGSGRERPELVEQALPFEAAISALPCRGGEGFLRRLFEPLGYAVDAKRHELDPAFPEWGESAYFSVALRARVRLRELLQHLTVLIPVLDDDKHYWVGSDEVEKLLRRGERWLAAHPEREAITERYLRRQRGLVRSALARLADDAAANGELEGAGDRDEEAIERPISLAVQRAGAVLAVLRDAGAQSVGDLGCGEGRFLRLLLDETKIPRIVGVDASLRALEIAAKRLGLERMPPAKRERIALHHGALTYRDRRLEGLDALTLIEVIEHLDASRLPALERNVFELAHPRVVVVTTPNVEYNARFAELPTGRLRHRDHRFEWARAEFAGWCDAIAARFGYAVRRTGIGTEDASLGAPTQMAVFRRE